MRPMRSGWGGFGRPGNPLESAAAKLALAVVVGSLLFAVTARGGGPGLSLLLVPGAVLPGLALWQLLTYAFIATDTFSVFISALMIWQLGGALEQSWGSRRTLVFALGVTVGAAALTVLAGLVVPGLRDHPYPGAMVLTSVLWVAFGLSWGRGQANFWGIPVTGNTLALIGVGFVVLNAAFAGPESVVPSAFGVALTWVSLRLGSPRMLWLRLQSWRLQRQLRGSQRRRNHLRVVGGRDEERPRDRYLN
jgi:membrane associated rhomboid family serine protease